jgi:hypothetical protein
LKTLHSPVGWGLRQRHAVLAHRLAQLPSEQRSGVRLPGTALRRDVAEMSPSCRRAERSGGRGPLRLNSSCGRSRRELYRCSTRLLPGETGFEALAAHAEWKQPPAGGSACWSGGRWLPGQLAGRHAGGIGASGDTAAWEAWRTARMGLTGLPWQAGRPATSTGAGSSNGRTTGPGPANRGSSPCPAAAMSSCLHMPL